MNKWQNIGNGKKLKEMLGGKLVLIAPENINSIVPLFCNCCKFPMKTSEDSIAFRKVGVCSHCNDRWTNKPGIVWPSGPSKKSKEWKEYIEIRTKLSKPVFKFE